METGRDTGREEGEGMGVRKGSGKSPSKLGKLDFQVAWLQEEESGEKTGGKGDRESRGTRATSINKDGPDSCGSSMLHSSGMLARTSTSTLVTPPPPEGLTGASIPSHK